MPKKVEKEQPDSASMHIRGIPIEMFFRFKMAAAAEHKTARDLILELMESKIQEMEKRGVLPKGK